MHVHFGRHVERRAALRVYKRAVLGAVDHLL